MTEPNAPPPWARWAWLIAALPLLGWWSCGLFDLDEGFYGAVAAEMNRRGEWITPYYAGQPWFEKPILLYWLAKPALAVFGDLVGPRLPSVVASIALYWLVARFARRNLAPAAEWIAPLVLGGSLLVAAAGRMMLTDPLLVLCFTAGLLAFWESLHGGARWPSGLALGLGILAKGPVVLLLFVPIALWTFWRERDLRPGFRRGWVGFVAALALAAASWYVPAYLANGQTFVQKFLIEQNVGRFTGGDAAHTLGIASLPLYIPILFLGMAPWSGWIFAAWPRRANPSTGALHRFLAASAAIVLLFFSLSGAKLPHYVLPCTPPLALLLADHLARRPFPALRPLALGWVGFLTAFVTPGFLSWYRASGQLDAHALIRQLNAETGAVALYQLGRREADRGTGSTRLRETSLPSLRMYLHRPARDVERPEELGQLAAGDWVFTRSGRIAPVEAERYALRRVQARGGFETWRRDANAR